MDHRRQRRSRGDILGAPLELEDPGHSYMSRDSEAESKVQGGNEKVHFWGPRGDQSDRRKWELKLGSTLVRVNDCRNQRPC